ncbi:hypothetical protein OQA88_1569 [Cercophora sp. LCS_1]
MGQQSQSAAPLRLNHVLNPITALEEYTEHAGERYILAAEDGWLKVYSLRTDTLLGQMRIFGSQSIHGIYVPESAGQIDYILLWGGHSVTLLPESSLCDLLKGNTPPSPEELKGPDWIYDGILFSNQGPEGALITAHNEVLPIIPGKDGRPFSFGPLTSPSRPILYSANLCLLTPETVLVAGGTVFGEIIVWKYHLDSSRASQWELLYVFTGHEGSIFGVSISPDLEVAPDTKVRLLASCSDDRTVRVWDITDYSQTTVSDGLPQIAALAEARETGFGGNSEATAGNKKDSLRCVATAMGHISRIWHVKFESRTEQQTQQYAPVVVYSFGEDCSRQKWELDLDLPTSRDTLNTTPNGTATSVVTSPARLSGTLRHINQSTCHNGKNIWSALVSRKTSSSLVMSGGADSKIVASARSRTSQDEIDLNLTFDEFTQALRELSLGDHPKRPATTVKNGFNRYAFMSQNKLLMTSTSGELFLGTLGSPILWKKVEVSEAIQAGLGAFQVIRSPIEGTAFIGSAPGKVYLYTEPLGIKELAQYQSKITDIVRLGGRDQRQQQTVIVTVLGQDHAHILSYDTKTGEACQDPRLLHFDKDYSCYILTSAAYCGDKLILGSRVGVLSLYTETSNAFTMIHSRKDCKTKDAITSILPLPGSTTSFLTTGRDGKYRVYTITTPTPSSPTMVLQHEISPPLSIIEGAIFSKSPQTNTLDLIFHGFRGKSFIAWNETRCDELANINCGNPHRPFSYISSPTDPGKLVFVFTLSGQMRLHAQSKPPLRTLKQGGHGREIRAVAASASSKYIATAAEDTTIRIWQYADDTSDPRLRGFKSLAVLEKHSAGIQALQWHGDEYLISSAGNEEFYIWHVTRFESEYQGLAVVCEAGYLDRSPDGDLRIMNFDVQGWKDDNGMLITMVLSNSTVRSYRYSKMGGFGLLGVGRYTGACLTQVRHLRVDEGEGIWVVTASTDGLVSVWKLEGTEYGLGLVTRVHQSSIKSMDLFVEGDRWSVVCGGDDNALAFLDLEWNGVSFVVVGKSRVRSAHAAAVTGLKVLRGGDGVVEVATVSNDQRAKVWRASRRGDGTEGVSVALLANEYSSIADAGDLEVIAPGRLMVGGVGMEVWEV